MVPRSPQRSSLSNCALRRLVKLRCRSERSPVSCRLKILKLRSRDEMVRIAEAVMVMGWSLASRGIFTGGILKTVFCAVATSGESPVARNKASARRGERRFMKRKDSDATCETIPCHHSAGFWKRAWILDASRPLEVSARLPRDSDVGSMFGQSFPNYRESWPVGLVSQRILLGRAWPTSNQVACFVPAGKGVLTKGGVALPLGFDAGGENCRSPSTSLRAGSRLRS